MVRRYGADLHVAPIHIGNDQHLEPAVSRDSRTLNVITDIANETNLLARNQLSRWLVGYAGKGFARVEDLIKLADPSRNGR